MEVGERIKILRTKKGITVNKLANLAGISQSYLRDIELGKKQPTVEYLLYICDALGISLESFFAECNENRSLAEEIEKLTGEQKKTLLAFIKTINNI